MMQSNRLRVLAVLTLVATLLIVAIVLWQRGRGASVTPPASPLSVPATAADDAPSSSRLGLAAAAFWVVLGGALALGVALFFLRRYR